MNDDAPPKILRPTDQCLCAQERPWCDTPATLTDRGGGWYALTCPNPACGQVWS